jgi:hypothetical protein
MKKIFTLSLLLLITCGIFAQPPQKMSYQAVIRDAASNLVKNHVVGMRISILQGSASGIAVYSETQTPTTNANGLVSIEIGGGAGFSTINWESGPYFLKTETDPLGGTSYTIVGTSQLLSVPYALYSGSSATFDETDPKWSGAANQTGQIGRLGNVGIGTNSPNDLLELYTNSNVSYPHLLLTESEGDYSRMMFKNTDAVTKNWTIAGRTSATDANSLLNFFYFNGTAGNDILSISGTGKVGIGTYTPPYNLSIDGRSLNSEMSFINDFNGLTATDGLRIGLSSSSGNSWIWSYENAKLYFGTNNLERLSILGNGNVGIGDPTPDATLDVEGTVVFGSAGKVFSEIREITGTTSASGSYTTVSYPSGYTITNTRVLSLEINQLGSYWSTFGMYIIGNNSVGCSLSSGSISLYYPNDASYQSKAYRMLLMKVQ